MITAQVTTKNLGGLKALIDQCKNPQAALKEVGRRGVNELKTWFRGRDKVPNKLGGRRSHLWRKIADSVNQPVLVGAQRVRISVTHPVIKQKVEGGTITPKRAKALTIPADPLAYDRTAAVFQKETGIQLFTTKKNGAVSRFLFGRVGKQVKVFYVLAKSVDQDKDPDALPPQAAWNAALLDQAQKALARQNQPPTAE